MDLLLLQFGLWIKALHVIAVIAWMAGLLYLPRLFVYHTEAKSEEARATFALMERRLLKIIMNPAMLVTWGAGLLLIGSNAGFYASQGWFWAKLVLVVGMTLAHGLQARWFRLFDTLNKPARFYRIANEVPTLLMIGIVILVIVRPF